MNINALETHKTRAAQCSLYIIGHETLTSILQTQCFFLVLVMIYYNNIIMFTSLKKNKKLTIFKQKIESRLKIKLTIFKQKICHVLTRRMNRIWVFIYIVQLYTYILHNPHIELHYFIERYYLFTRVFFCYGGNRRF